VSCGKESKPHGPHKPSWTLRCKHCGCKFGDQGWTVLERHATPDQLELAASHYL
jgi:hypothetical protein